MPPVSMTVSPSFLSSNVNPYWNPEHPPPWMKIRSGFPAESGIVPAKYLTLATAASVSDRSAPGAPVIGVGTEDSTVDMWLSSRELWSAFRGLCNGLGSGVERRVCEDLVDRRPGRVHRGRRRDERNLLRRHLEILD